MQTADLIKYINDPQLLDKQSIGELQKLAADFPYFQPAHMLLSMASRKWDASVYQQSLKRTAIVVTNRERLFQLIHTIENAEVKIPEPQITPVIEATVAGVKQELPVTVVEEIKQEVKTPELVKEPEPEVIETTPVAETELVEEAIKEAEPVVDILSLITAKPAKEILEKEIQKQVVNSFVEKEILKTPELHHPKPVIEPGNFGDWLSLLKKNNGTPLRTVETKFTETKPEVKEEEPVITPPAKNPELQNKQQKHRAIIDKIIESSPGLIRTKEEQKFYTPDIKAKESLLDNEHLVTETLAKIYALQGNVNKAVRAYEILSLKFPQKSAYFATLIKNLKNNQ